MVCADQLSNVIEYGIELVTDTTYLYLCYAVMTDSLI